MVTKNNKQSAAGLEFEKIMKANFKRINEGNKTGDYKDIIKQGLLRSRSSQLNVLMNSANAVIDLVYLKNDYINKDNGSSIGEKITKIARGNYKALIDYTANKNIFGINRDHGETVGGLDVVYFGGNEFLELSKIKDENEQRKQFLIKVIVKMNVAFIFSSGNLEGFFSLKKSTGQVRMKKSFVAFMQDSFGILTDKVKGDKKKTRDLNFTNIDADYLKRYSSFINDHSVDLGLMLDNDFIHNIIQKAEKAQEKKSSTGASVQAKSENEDSPWAGSNSEKSKNDNQELIKLGKKYQQLNTLQCPECKSTALKSDNKILICGNKVTKKNSEGRELKKKISCDTTMIKINK